MVFLVTGTLFKDIESPFSFLDCKDGLCCHDCPCPFATKKAS